MKTGRWKIIVLFICVCLLFSGCIKTEKDELFTVYGESQRYVFDSDGLVASGEDIYTVPDQITGEERYYVHRQYDWENKKQRTIIYDQNGTEVADVDASILGIMGHYACLYQWDFIVYCGVGSDPLKEYKDGVLFVDLRNGEIVWEPGRCSVGCLDDQHLVVRIQEDIEKDPDTLIVRIKDLAVVQSLNGLAGCCYMEADFHQSWRAVHNYGLLYFRDENSEYVYNYPLKQQYTNVQWRAGQALVTGEIDAYTLISWKDGKVVVEDTDRSYDFWSEKAAVWYHDEEYWLETDFLEDKVAVKKLSRGYHADYLVVQENKTGGNVCVFDEDGNLCVQVAMKEGQVAYDLENGWICVQDKDETVLYSIEKKEYHFPGMRNITPLFMPNAREQRFQYKIHDRKMQLLDENGKGIGDYFQTIFINRNNEKVIAAQKDGKIILLDLDGNLVWSEEEDR